MEESDMKRFKCSECSYSASTTSDLRKHSRSHSGERPFKCALCDKSFKSSSNRNKHEFIHSEDKKFQCDICLAKYSEKGTLNKHMRIHTGKNLFECDSCGRKFYQKGAIKAHMSIHTGEREFLCSKCSQNFRQKGELEKHLQIHEEKQVTCSRCGVILKSSYSLKRHIRRIHSGKKIPCEVCGKEFNRRENCNLHYLRKHKETHKGEKRFCCSQCDKQCESRKALQHHVLEHGGEFYCCPHCNVGYSSRLDLDKHWVVHQGQPFVCRECKEVFVTVTAYSFHSRVSMPGNKLTCPFCEKCLLKKSFVKHMKDIHASIEDLGDNLEGTFPCVSCDELFSSERSLLWHELCHHDSMKCLKSDSVNCAGKNTSSESDQLKNERTKHFEQQRIDPMKGMEDASEKMLSSSTVYIKEEMTVVEVTANSWKFWRIISRCWRLPHNPRFCRRILHIENCRLLCVGREASFNMHPRRKKFWYSAKVCSYKLFFFITIGTLYTPESVLITK